MPTPSRLSVVEQVYHQVPDGKSTAVVSRFGIDLSAASPVYESTFTVSEEWTALPGQLPPRISMLVVQLSKPIRKVMPTHEERAAESTRSVLIGFGPKPVTASGNRTQHSPPVVPFTCSPVIKVGNGESCRFCPVDVDHVWVRATCPGVTITVTAIPG